MYLSIHPFILPSSLCPSIPSCLHSIYPYILSIYLLSVSEWFSRANDFAFPRTPVNSWRRFWSPQLAGVAPLTCNGWRPGLLLIHRTGLGTPCIRGPCSPDASGAEAEKPCPGVTVWLPIYLCYLSVFSVYGSTYCIYPLILSIHPSSICASIHHLASYLFCLSTHSPSYLLILFIHLLILSIHPSTCPSIHPSIYLLYPSIHSPIFLLSHSIYLSTYSIHPFIVYLSTHSPICLLILSVHPSIHPPVYLLILFISVYLFYLSTHSSICLLILFIHLLILSIHSSPYLFIHLSLYLLILSVHPFTHLYIHPSSM